MSIYTILITVILMVSVGLMGMISVLFIKELMRYVRYRERVSQLSFAKEKDVSVDEFIEKITKYINMYIFKNEKTPSEEIIESQLKMIGWDKWFGPSEWRAVKTFMILLGGLLGITISIVSVPFGCIVGMMTAFVPIGLYKSELKDKTNKLMSKFPDLIMIMQGYLDAGLILTDAIVETIPFTNECWAKLLKKMVADIELNGVAHALNELSQSVDIIEIKEFAAIIKVAYEQGDIGDSFKIQAERMESIQDDRMMMMVDARGRLAKIAQAPTLLSIFIVGGSPAIRQLLNITNAM